MATAFRSDADVTNGTAGTSVTVAKPAGIVDTGANPDRDHLIAFIAATGIPSFTAPADWTLITTAVDATNAVTLKAYRKLASSEGASWTWTLGTSQRNWGWVGAYTGVDPDSPVLDFAEDITLDSSTILQEFATLPSHGQGLSAGAAVRTASGAATTWTHTSTERADLSTNAGAGTDIAGVVGDSIWDAGYTTLYGPEATASQAQTAGAMIVVTLNPYFVPYGGGVGDAGLILEAALGVDPDSDSSTWTWTDLTSFGLHSSRLVLEHGRSNRAVVADPSRMTFSLLNINGEFTGPTGAYTQYMVRNLPFRVRLNGFGVSVGGKGYHRGTAFLASMRPRWDASTNFAVVDIVAQGRLRRLQQRTDVLHSAAYTAIQRMTSDSGFATPVAHWPFEDESGSTSAASAVPGVSPAATSGLTFAVDNSVLGSNSLPTLSATSTIVATVPAHASTGTWTVMFVATMPAEPAAATTLLEVVTTGTARTWRAIITSGAPSTLTLQVFDTSGTSVLNTSVSITEADFYGSPEFYTLTATQNGTGIDYSLTGNGIVGGVSGTLASQTAGIVTLNRNGPAAGLAGVAFGHLALHTAPGAEGTFSTLPILAGNSVGGDFTWERFQRLCQEQNIPYTFDVDTAFDDATMGRQTVATLMTLLRECETVDGCVLNDSGELTDETGLLWFPARADRYNLNATMTLDIASGEVAQPFEPALDDQDVVNDVEVSNVGGSSSRVTDEASIATEGRYRELVSVNTYDDSFLAQIAGWRVNLGTVRGMRFPAVEWNLRKSSTLAQEWMACRLFHRIDITNPPSQYPPDDIQTILEGYAEVLAQDDWTVRGYLSPYQPNKVFELAETSADQNQWAGRLAGDDPAAIRVAIDSDDTSIVFDPNAFRWTLVADDFDPDPKVRLGWPGEVVAVSGISTTAATFVAAGTAASAHSGNVTPGLPAGTQAGDLLLIFAAIRATTGGVNTPTDY
ncbi:MAG: hypothetical protein ACM30G_01175, partial [Micromonosporaceae bacterium]